MNRKSIIFFSLILFIISCLSLAKNQKTIVESDFNDSSYWLLSGRNQTIENGYLYLTVDDHDGRWSYSKVQKGILPHGWTRKDVIDEIEFKKGIEANEGYFYVKILTERSNFTFYDSSESWVNFAIGLWFQLNDAYDDPDSTQLVVDIRFVSVNNGNFITDDIAFIGSPFDNDYHYLVTVDNFMKEPNKQYEIVYDCGKAIKKAFDYFNIAKAKLKCIDVYLEANYGYGEAKIDYIKVYTDPQPNSAYVLYNSIIIFILSFILLSFIAYLIK